MDSLKTEKIRPSKQQDVFITKTATKTLTSTAVVEKVINFHFRDLVRALRSYSSVEVSGFGRFDISQNKLHRKLKQLKRIYEAMNKMYEKNAYTRPKESMETRLSSLKENIEYLESKKTIDETKLQGYFRGMEESLTASSQAERTDTTD